MTRPICKCHGLPKLKNGHVRGRQNWMCRVTAARRNDLSNARRITIGSTYYGLVPTAEAAAAISAWGRRERREFIANQTKEN